MLSFAISICVGFILGGLTYPLGWFWCVSSGFVGFIASQLLVGLLVRKVVQKGFADVQKVILEGQDRINRKIAMFQRKPVGSAKTMQAMIEKDQKESLTAALAESAKLDRFRKWNLLLGKQINTTRMQLHYQMKDFESVDRLLPACIFLEPTSLAMKMARQYKNDDPNLEKSWKKARRHKGEKAVVLYALYSWILVKRGQVDEAIKVLAEAKRVTENPVLAANWDKLVNGKIKHFSNSGIGEPWYALHLEQPKMKQKRMKRQPY